MHVSGGVQHAFNSKWMVSADYTHEQGNHGFRRYQYQAGFTLFSPLVPSDVDDQRAVVPNITVFKSDNRSSYNGLLTPPAGQRVTAIKFNRKLHFVARLEPWGCILGELFDYVNGVCNPLKPFGKGDYGPSGEDVLSRFVLAGTLKVPGAVRANYSHASGKRPAVYVDYYHSGHRPRRWL